MTQAKISVITVCFNAQEELEATIESVLMQDYAPIEYIIIDGGSTDSTPNILNRYKEKSVKIISEKDSGIYDAMNKGIGLSSGEYIYFLNAGDRFYSNDILSRVVSSLSDGIDIYYGDVMGITGERQRIIKFDKVSRLFLSGNTICHQAMFVRRALFINNGYFDLQYKIASDYDWLLRMIVKHRARFRYFEAVIAYYSMSGVSNDASQRKIALSEQYTISRKYFGLTYYVINKLLLYSKKYLYALYIILIRKNPI